MAATFDDEAERTFFMDHQLNTQNALLYIQLLGETKRVDRVHSFLKEMREAGLDVDAMAYCAAISACAPAARAEDALRLEKEMIEGALPLLCVCASDTAASRHSARQSHEGGCD